ncbi:glycoside hydrolase family 76 protein [Rothia sp. ZJ1223]|uniref:glycoside hydrolase family 76 protein n=1 Tax=Rothia sp. ZJ1223 TaxID=2811098 RepID=UPI00195CC8E2|nr:glycoside hydrolase family 76 protein [Rothia sp. ZJ1223]MBM7052201.1 glycoside hydrolase family 76 [Rothia sp. ZJ1223]
MTTDFSQYSDLAARSVMHHFGTRVLGVPGTLLGKVVAPDRRSRGDKFKHWHYWWQAHFLDNAVDAGFRCLRAHQREDAHQWLQRAQALQRGITARNFGTVINDYYDDMAWLTLALERMNRLHLALHGTGDVRAQDAAVTLYTQLTEACNDELGGGAFWSKARDFKNTPATAPIALAFARAHRLEDAAELLGWLRTRLWDADEGIYRDGLRMIGGSVESTRLESAAYSYNSGPVLAATLALAAQVSERVRPVEAGDIGSLQDAREHARAIVEGVARQFTQPFDTGAETVQVLKTFGDGDGGLFTGILTRYLAEAARSPLVDEQTRTLARTLVCDTARVLWMGRREFDPNLQVNLAGVDVTEIQGESVALFSPNPVEHASDALVPGARVELSPQLQAWMIFEAAATLS